MTDRLKQIAAILVAASGFLTAATTALEAHRKQAADEWVVRVLAEQLAEAREDCR